MSRGRGHSVHIDPIDIGAFLAVDLDAHEPLIQEPGRLIVLERLVCHHVTPVTCRVADGEQHRHVPFGGLSERVAPPLPPRHRIVPVLEQIRRGCVCESIGHEATVPAPAT